MVIQRQAGAYYLIGNCQLPLYDIIISRSVLSMSMKFSSGHGKRKNTGFSAAIGLCIAAVALVAAATVINNRGGKPDFISGYVSNETEAPWAGQEEQPEVYIDEPAEQTAETAPATQPETPQTAPVEAVNEYPEIVDMDVDLTETDEQPEYEAEAVAVSAPVSYRMPLSGTVSKDFSGDELTYCATMCDWRVHQGIDITGESDCEVRAAADGIVVDFVEDMLYGYTAIIRQEDDSMLYYCGLSSVPMVTAGLEVHAGDVIGRLGTVPCEASEQPHLHLALMKDGEFASPLSVMGL